MRGWRGLEERSDDDTGPERPLTGEAEREGCWKGFLIVYDASLPRTDFRSCNGEDPMDFVGKPLSGTMLINAHYHCIQECTRVRAAVAYAASDNMALFQDCADKSVPLEFFGRYDGSCAIDPRILRWFLDRKSPSVSCRMVPLWLHAKVIWWEGEGVYIGSANLTDRAWMKNYEAGVFLSDAEMKHQALDAELEIFFDELRSRSHPLSDEIYNSQKQLYEKRQKFMRELSRVQSDFEKADHLTANATNPIVVNPAKADTRRYDRFVREWNETLQHMRDVAARVSDPAVRPVWIRSDVPPGVQADQFLHAYYYLQVRDGLRHPYEEEHVRNRSDPEAALKPLLTWWHDSDFDYSHEQTTIDEWAPIIRKAFAKERVLRLDVDEWVEAASCVHAIRDHATKMENTLLSLPPTQQNHEEKIEAFCRWLWTQRSKGGHSCLELIDFVVWGPGDITRRLWEGVWNPDWRLPHVAISTLGEIVGWANPDLYPPRNMRTSKSLRALGYDVKVSI